MLLEDYFEFLDPLDIRLKGHRIGIDDVLNYYRDGYLPDEIRNELPTLTLEEIYATITYYLANQQEIDSYLLRVERRREQRYQEWRADPNPPAVVQRLRQLSAECERELLTEG
jgi:uncharacterized protein (DUF433 family)